MAEVKAIARVSGQRLNKLIVAAAHPGDTQRIRVRAPSQRFLAYALEVSGMKPFHKSRCQSSILGAEGAHRRHRDAYRPVGLEVVAQAPQDAFDPFLEARGLQASAARNPPLPADVDYREAGALRRRSRFLRIGMQELGAEFYWSREFRDVDGPDSTANPVARLQNGDIAPPCNESLRRGESSDAGPNDDDVVALQAYT
jgi:hypothetical protein